MEVIDGKWIKARLTGRRGEITELANALGISSDKLTKSISGIRNVQPDEVPKLLAFFNDREPLNRKEQLLRRFESLPPAEQEQALDFLEYLKEKSKKQSSLPDLPQEDS